jgi:hypothetical protein
LILVTCTCFFSRTHPQIISRHPKSSTIPNHSQQQNHHPQSQIIHNNIYSQQKIIHKLRGKKRKRKRKTSAGRPYVCARPPTARRPPRPLCHAPPHAPVHLSPGGRASLNRRKPALLARPLPRARIERGKGNDKKREEENKGRDGC